MRFLVILKSIFFLFMKIKFFFILWILILLKKYFVWFKILGYFEYWILKNVDMLWGNLVNKILKSKEKVRYLRWFFVGSIVFLLLWE